MAVQKSLLSGIFFASAKTWAQSITEAPAF